MDKEETIPRMGKKMSLQPAVTGDPDLGRTKGGQRHSACCYHTQLIGKSDQGLSLAKAKERLSALYQGF